MAPRRGALLIMRGDRALHSVRTVGGSEDRINLILAYDVPGSACTRDTLNTYLYSDIPAMAGDPNYSAQEAPPCRFIGGLPAILRLRASRSRVAGHIHRGIGVRGRR